MLDIKDRIFEAIAEFAKTHSYVQSVIYLSKLDYKELLSEARSTELGRAFTANGMKFCQLDVKVHGRDEIVIG